MYSKEVLAKMDNSTWFELGWLTLSDGIDKLIAERRIQVKEITKMVKAQKGLHTKPKMDDHTETKMEGFGMLTEVPVKTDGRKLWQYISAVSASILAVGVGTALAWTSPVLPKLIKEDSFLPITSEEGSWIGSLCAIGAVIGALPSGAISDKYGRKKVLLLLAVPFLISWLMIIFATSVWILYVARVIVGIGVGAACVLVPTYISEIAEISARGSLGAMFQLFLTIGIVIGFAVGALVGYTTFAVVCAMVEVLYLLCFYWMPESPVWLMGQRRKMQATAALELLRGDEYDISRELSIMQKEAETNSSKESSVMDLVRTRAARKALIASLGGMIFQQLSGVNAVVFYTVIIFQAAGSSINPDIAAVSVALVQAVMSGAAAVIVDKAGRKPLLMFSSALMSLSLIALGYYFKVKDGGDDVSSLGWLPLSSLVVYMIAFSIGLGPIPWMLMGELFTVDLKGTASAVAVMINWLLVFFVTKTFPSMKESLGAAITFWIFAGIMIIATVFTLIFIPETKGKSTQTIQNELNGIR